MRATIKPAVCRDSDALTAVRIAINAALLIVPLVCCISSGQDSPPHPAEEKFGVPIFAIMASEKGHSISIDPMFFLGDGGFRPVPDPCSESSALHAFESEYLRPGKTYSLVFGGVTHGTVSVSSPEGPERLVKLDSDIRLTGLTMALAADPSVVPSQRQTARHDPTSDEKGHAEALAKEILTKRGASVAALARLLLAQIAVTEIARRPQLIVSAEIERPDKMGMEYSLFFIADPHSNEATVLWFQKPKGETDAEAIYLLDQLRGDNGVERIFVRRVFYENYRYEVYRNQKAHWSKEFESAVFGCE